MYLLTIFALIVGVTLSGSIAFVEALRRDLSYRTVYEFENETWVENLALRANSNILTTLITAAELWEVNPFLHTAELVTQFPNASSSLGITELAPDVFAVVVGKWDPATFEATPGSWSVWTIDYSSLMAKPNVQKISDIPSAGFLNGITTLSTQENALLIADSYRGIVYALDARTGAHFVAIDSPALKPNSSAVAKLGVNGIHFHEDDGRTYLYFTNSFNTPVLGRILLHPNGTAAGAAETIVESPTYLTNAGAQADDFAIDERGHIWLTTDPSNTLLKVDLASGKVHVVAGGVNDSLIAGDTAAAFGRGQIDQEVLYVVTNGGIAYPPPGGVAGGKIVAFTVNLDSFES